MSLQGEFSRILMLIKSGDIETNLGPKNSLT